MFSVLELSNCVSGWINCAQKKCSVIGTSLSSNYVKTCMGQFENTFIFCHYIDIIWSFRMEQKKNFQILSKNWTLVTHWFDYIHSGDRTEFLNVTVYKRVEKYVFQKSIMDPLIEETFKTTNRLILNLCRSVYLSASPFTWKKFARKKQNSTSNCS